MQHVRKSVIREPCVFITINLVLNPEWATDEAPSPVRVLYINVAE